jgi:DNA processing protein
MTSLFGLDRAEVAALAASVAPGADPAEVFARSTFTLIAEPGDRLAGVLVATLGAPAALTLLVESAPLSVIASALREHEVDDRVLAELRAALDRWTPRLTAPAAKRALSQAARFGVRLLMPSDDVWPRGVNDLGAHAPIDLWMRGQAAALGALSTSISLVGARAATGYGEHVTMEASAGLVDRGFAIVSGAAFGIDGMAHRAALASKGTTVALLAGGLDRFYPSAHDALLARIVEAGAVLSEVPCGTTPTKWRFLQRNRLIAAISQATVVVEAGWRSGSLNTASHALDLGRPVGAVPGPVTSAASAGCHRLIREKPVTLVTSADEMEALVTGVDPSPGTFSQEHTEAARLLDALSTRSPRSAPDLAARCGLSIAAVQALLGELELEGKVRETDRGWLLPPKPRDQ